MNLTLHNRIRAIAIPLLILSFASISSLQAQIVQPSELRDALAKASVNRQNDLAQLHAFFQDKSVRPILMKSGMDVERVEKSVASLDSGDLAILAARAQKIQNDIAAGALSNQQLTYIVIALVTAVIVLVLVH